MNASAPFVVSAPGKVFLMGEYAVLEGADAVVMAVSRRVRARRGHGRMRPLVARARRLAAWSLGQPHLGAIPWEADSSPLYHGRTKMGLGSSAAISAASVASVFVESGEDITAAEVRHQIWDIAHRAHVEWSRSRGSGADVAASVFGGFVRFRQDGPNAARIESWAPPPGIRFVFVWSKQDARTQTMIRRVRRVQRVFPGTYRRFVDEMGEVSRRFVEGGTRDAKVLIESVDRYQHLLTWLGRLAGVPIVTPLASAIHAVAREFGGAAKPSGAGGGDLVVAFLSEDVDIAAFGARFGPVSPEFVDLDMDPDGVRVEEERP